MRAFFARVWRRPERFVALAGALALALVAVGILVAPLWEETRTFGFHDWDVETSFRWLTVKALVDHGELPGFNPYACGGYPAWGYVEGATNLVSPWLWAYLTLPIQIAIRVEATGMALVGALGAFAWASRLTKSQAGRLLVVALWAVNGRWGLQTASGHLWHLAYAYLPWCGFFFEGAIGRRPRTRHLAGLGVGFALLVYSGGIYPLPHTVVGLGLYALFRAIAERRARPLVALALGGAVGVGLAAPKLLPMLHTFSADPRLIESKEVLGLGDLLTVVTSRAQGFYDRPAPVHPYGWHEWGMYLGWAGVAALGAGVVFTRGRRGRALKAAGLVLLVLGLGAFHELSPWSLLHTHVPFFRSQHVPSRWLYPAALLLALTAGVGLGAIAARRPWLDLVMVGVVGAIAVNVASVAQKPLRQAMWMVAPPILPAERFEHAIEPPVHYVRRDWAGPMLLSMMANTGVLNCYGVPRPEGWRWRARARGEVGYRGMVYLEGPGSAALVDWSPNRVVARVAGVEPGTLLVYNLHHWPGWQSDAGEVRPHQGLVATPVGRDGLVELSYRPPDLTRGLVCASLTIFALVFLWRWRRR